MSGRLPPSLRRRLALSTVAVLSASLCAFSLLLHATFSRALSRQFEDTLAADARAIANLAERNDDGTWTVEPEALAALAQGLGPALFEVWSPEDRVIVRSSHLGDEDLPRASVRRVLLPGGEPARLYVAVLPVGGEDGPSQRITVAIARDTRELDSISGLLWGMLVVSGVVTLALAALVAVIATRRGLAPLGVLTHRLEEMDGARLDLRLPEEGLPEELRPIVSTLNGLLGRLEAAFARERQFSADASHELRTPLAGLRSILEVSSLRERPAEEHRRAIAEALGVARQMQALVESLLFLARLDAQQVTLEPRELCLRELVDECFAPFAGRARERSLGFENRVPDERVVTADREKLRIVLANLLGNATEYTERGGSIWVSSDAARGVLLEVEDSGPAIPEPALKRIFERFYRVDTSRAGTGEHCGIGLALVRSLCTALGCAVWAENRPEGRVAFVVAASRGVNR